LFGYANTSEIRAEMARTMPLYRGIETLEKEGDHIQWGGPSLGASGFVNMPEGRASFSVVRNPRIDVPADHLLLALRRGKQFNSITYGDRDPLTRGTRRGDILMDPRDLEAFGFEPGASVRLESEVGTMQAHVQPGPCRSGHVQGFWPECNVLIGRRYDPASGEPHYVTPVRIVRDDTASKA
jgi:predicted molibdopterin-dependent oxidoreductase YjgC